MSADERGATVSVLYVLRRNAKTVKESLEREGLLHKQYRMTQPSSDDYSLRDSCIAIPVTEKCLERDGAWAPMVASVGRQYCPYSSSFLGTHKSTSMSITSSHPELSTHVQQALLAALIQCSPQEVTEERKNDIVRKIKNLSISLCPKKLEVIGDDRTLVIPRKAFQKDDADFATLLSLAFGNNKVLTDWSNFWKYFAGYMGSSRVVRRGDIDPDSSIRESGHRLLWPHCGQPDETGAFRSSLHIMTSPPKLLFY